MRIFRFTAVIAILGALVAGRAGAQDSAVSANIDEAFRLAGVRSMLQSLPAHVNEMTVAAIAQIPKDKRQELEPLIKDASLKFLDPDAFYRELRTNFSRHYDAAHMATFLALERTPLYRTMHRLEESADTPAAQAARGRFGASLRADPPPAKRVAILQRLDEARGSTGLQVRIVIGIVNAVSAGLGAQMPSDLQNQSADFAARIRPILANNVLVSYLYTYRNTGDAELEDYVGAVQQKDVAWFDQTLQSAIVAVVADRSARAGEYIKTKVTKQ